MFSLFKSKATSPDISKQYEILQDLGKGKFGVAKLAKDKKTGELVAIKLIERGAKVRPSRGLNAGHCAATRDVGSQVVYGD